MGILDDLKKEAEQCQTEQRTEEGEEARLETVYQVKGKPRMKAIVSYLHEMLEQLKVVKLKVPVAYDVPGVGLVKDLCQGDYRIFLDNKQTPRKVALQFTCTAPVVSKYAVSPMSVADETRQFLQKQRIHFSEWGVRDPQDQLVGAQFECQIQIRVKLVFTVDVENERISLITINRHGLTMKHSHYGFGSINEKWMDELGHYILRKTEQLGVLDMSEDAKQKIRRRIQQEQKQRLQELDQKENSLESAKDSKLGRVMKQLNKPLFKSKN